MAEPPKKKIYEWTTKKKMNRPRVYPTNTKSSLLIEIIESVRYAQLWGYIITPVWYMEELEGAVQSLPTGIDIA